jgi:hypothetical protein
MKAYVDMVVKLHAFNFVPRLTHKNSESVIAYVHCHLSWWQWSCSLQSSNRCKTGIMDSNSTRGMDVCTQFLRVGVVLCKHRPCVGSGRSPIQAVLPHIFGFIVSELILNWNRPKGPILDRWIIPDVDYTGVFIQIRAVAGQLDSSYCSCSTEPVTHSLCVYMYRQYTTWRVFNTFRCKDYM